LQDPADRTINQMASSGDRGGADCFTSKEDTFAETKREIDEARQQRGGSAKQLAEGEVALGAAPNSLHALRVSFEVVDKEGHAETSDAYLTCY
jgi:hypothetical protein